MDTRAYLQNLPQSLEEYGFCKTLAVRKEMINVKHIFTECFVRKSIELEKELKELDMSLFEYMLYMTNCIRKIYNLSRDYRGDLNLILKSDNTRFFPTLSLYEGLKNVVVLDFDGVLTKESFIPLYELIMARAKTVIVNTANPLLTNEWFDNKGLKRPSQIFANKGKLKKKKRLLELSKKYANVFYIDDEEEYLKTAWLFNIKTFIFKKGKIKEYSRQWR